MEAMAPVPGMADAAWPQYCRKKGRVLEGRAAFKNPVQKEPKKNQPHYTAAEAISFRE